MVCKEDVFLWFKDLESFKRIDVMYELLTMCIPFEVRFLGSCIEEIGKHTFQELRGPTIIANDVDRLSKDPNLHEGLLNETTRHRTVIYMSVLSARNYTCANWFYRTLFRSERVENYVDNPDNDNTLHELLLLFTLGLYHPAFTFEQKSYFGKLLEKLIAYSEAKKFSAQHYLPGSVSSPRHFSSLTLDAHTIPVKSSSIMPSGDSLLMQHPPGIPHPQHSMPHIEFISSMMPRTGFPTTVVGAPEVHPFPPQPISPLVSQATSPPQSRATSPHRTYNIRPLSATGMSLLPQPPPPSIHIETLPLLQPTSIPAYKSLHEVVSIHNSEDDTNHIQEDISRADTGWQNQYDSGKQLNGIRINQKIPPHLHEQLQNLKLEGENMQHCSSSASSNSSINQSPTETPSVTPAVTPHGHGRCNNADSKNRVNGIPQYICENYTPPFSNVSSCYSMAHMPPGNRYYPYRYPSQPYPYPSNDMYHPYLIFSSVLQHPPPRNLNCYNCGGIGHSGIDCNGHTVEDITQKPYMLEYDSPTLPDNPPEK